MRLGCTSSSLVLTLSLLVSVSAHEKEKDRQSTTQTRIEPAERVEKLLIILKDERKEDQRVKAVEELGKLASSQFPEIASGLIDVLVRDSSTSVRKAVVHSLAAIRPATHEVKDALEQAVKQDKSWTVRQAARIALWKYQPEDEPPTMPGPRLRNTSKPPNTGKVDRVKSAQVKPALPEDPLKSLPIPQQPTPVLPAVPAEKNTSKTTGNP